MERVSLADRTARLDVRWQPQVVAGDSGNGAVGVKVEGEFPSHDRPDDLFLCLSGGATIDLSDRSIEPGPGEILAVRAGVRHCRRAEVEAGLRLVAPGGTPVPGGPAAAVCGSRV